MSGPTGGSTSRVGARPLSTLEAVLIATLAYVVLLIGLTGARIGRRTEPAVPVSPGTSPVAEPRPVALAPRAETIARDAGAFKPRAGTLEPRTAGQEPNAHAPRTETLVPPPAVSSCVTDRTVPHSYAADPGVTQPLAFGPPVESAGQTLSVAAVNGMLIQRLCGGPGTPGGPALGPDRRLFAALDAVVNGRDPNRDLTRADWAAGVDRFITRNALFLRASVVRRSARAGTPTLGMRARRGADPLVVRTRLAHANTSRYLVLPVHSDAGPIVVLTLRLPCGFQPIF